MTENRLIPLHQWNDYHIFPTPAQMNFLILHKEINGFNKLLRKRGGYQCIFERAFFEWVNTLAIEAQDKYK